MGKRGPVPKHSDTRRRRNKGPSAKDLLYKEAQRLGIPNRSKMSKVELERAIKAHGESSPPGADAKGSKMPPADKRWHRIARRWYESLGESGQSEFYESSDWALAQIVAEAISRDLKPVVIGLDKNGKPVRAERPMKGASLSAYLSSMTALMVSEGDRRRAGIELRKVASADEPEAPSNVTSMDKFRARAAGGS